MTTTLLSTPQTQRIINETLVKRALVNYHKANSENDLLVLSFTVVLTSASGENFCSDVYAVKVNYKLNGNDKEKSFIVKIMKPEVAEMGSNEELMFSTILPGMEDCLVADSERDCGNKLHARCSLSERNGNLEYYVLENLNTLGYFCGDRIDCLDENHSQILMQKLAKFHAASMIYAKKYPEAIERLQKPHFANGATDHIIQAITFGGLEYVANMIETWPGYEYLAPKLRSIRARFNELVIPVVDSQRATFNVITHGDLWTNNFLYKKENGGNEPIDVVFVDFQNSSWGSCGFDLNFLFYSSLELHVLKEKRLELLKIYSDSLKACLEANGYPAKEVPSWKDVLGEVKRNTLIGLYTSLCEMPIIVLERNISKNFTVDIYGIPEEMAKMRNYMYASEQVKQSLKYTLKHFEELELLQ